MMSCVTVTEHSSSFVTLCASEISDGGSGQPKFQQTDASLMSCLDGLKRAMLASERRENGDNTTSNVMCDCSNELMYGVRPGTCDTSNVTDS